MLRIAAGTLPPDQDWVSFTGRQLGAVTERTLARLLRSEVGLATRAEPSARTWIRDYVDLPLATGRWFGWCERRHRTMDALEDSGWPTVRTCAAVVRTM